jgi:hypothetical protein
LFALLLALSACRGAETPHRETQAPSVDLLAPYSPGAWRLAPQDIRKTVLSISDILVKHDEQEGKLGFEGRSRAQARARALEVAALAHANPARFAELARQYSDDTKTSAAGGWSGIQPARFIPDVLLDALNTMEPGVVSRVVEVPAGFCIVRLHETPPAQDIAARHIVVGYKDGPAFSLRDGRSVERSYEDARELAARIAQESALDPEHFPALIETYSDHADTLRGGDIGVWSTHDPQFMHRELALIASLKIGETSRPFEGLDGIAIFQRTDPGTRRELNATFLDVNVTPGLKSRLPRDVQPLAHGDVRSFDILQEKYGKVAPAQWTEGRGDPRLEQMLVTLEIGAVVPKPLELGGGKVRFYRRLAPGPKTTPAPMLTKLSAPARADVDALVSRGASGDTVAFFVAALRSGLGPQLGLSLRSEESQRVGEILDALERDVRASTDSAARLATLHDARRQLKQALGADKFAALQANVQSALKRQLLSQR